MNVKMLIKAAKQQQKKAYCPYSHFPVGSALITKSGKIYGGFNIENAAFGATMCAERVALYNAYANGVKYQDITAIAVITNTKTVAKPCGLCLQVMAEILPPQAMIILANNEGKVLQTELSKLLPLNFTDKDLKNK